MGRQPKDEAGNRFGSLVAIRYVTEPIRGWYCRCDCGGSKVVPGYTLRGHKQMTCGCRRGLSERMRELHRDPSSGLSRGRRKRFARMVKDRGRSSWEYESITKGDFDELGDWETVALNDPLDG